jgi:hypothetical protein
MKNTKIYKAFALVAILLAGIAGAKAADGSLQDSFRGNAKFNVVSVVLGIIFAGLAFFLIRLDKRVTGLEEKQKNQKS